MDKLQIFEPAMCCSTGLCGVSIDAELLRISTALNTLNENGIQIGRFNLNSAPQAFIDNKIVNEFINTHDLKELPITLLHDQIIITGHYPTNEDFIKLLSLPETIATQLAKPAKKPRQKLKKLSAQDSKGKGECCNGTVPNQ